MFVFFPFEELEEKDEDSALVLICTGAVAFFQGPDDPEMVKFFDDRTDCAELRGYLSTKWNI